MFKVFEDIYRDFIFLYNPFLWFPLPTIFVTWLLSRKTIRWQVREFLVPILVPPLWLALTFCVNERKSLTNIGIELFGLGIVVSVLFVVSVFIAKKRPSLKFPFLLISSLLITVLVQLLAPSLPE